MEGILNDPLPWVIVGRRADQSLPTYYLGFGDTAGDFAGYAVRQMLTSRLKQVEEQAQALRDILATGDPEFAERLLCDEARVSVSEVILRPKSGSAAVRAFVEQKFRASTNDCG